MPSLSDPIISISGLGQKTSDRLNQLGIHTLEHLLFHLPSRYQDKTTITSLSRASIEDEILIEVTIDRIEVIPARQRQLLCYLSDNQNQRVLKTLFGIELVSQSSEVNNKIKPKRIISKKIGRNDLCPCGSGKKYKKCCASKVN